MPDTWISVPIDTDEQALYDDAVATLRALKPGWEPAEGSLDTWILRAAARLASELRDVAADVPAAILRTYGREVFQLPALEPARATVATSWTAIDNAGHTIPAGTQFTLRDAAGTTGGNVPSSRPAVPGSADRPAPGPTPRQLREPRRSDATAPSRDTSGRSFRDRPRSPAGCVRVAPGRFRLPPGSCPRE